MILNNDEIRPAVKYNVERFAQAAFYTILVLNYNLKFPSSIIAPKLKKHSDTFAPMLKDRNVKNYNTLLKQKYIAKLLHIIKHKNFEHNGKYSSELKVCMFSC